jgi:hypothetical protein
MMGKQTVSALKSLFVERYPFARAALADLLLGDGYRVFQSDNAKSTISCIEQNRDVSRGSRRPGDAGWKSLVRYTLVTASNAAVIAMPVGH